MHSEQTLIKSSYFKYVVCILAFLLIGLYDVKDNFKGLYGSMAMLLLLLGAVAGSLIANYRALMWKLFFTGLCGFFLSTIVGAMFNASVKRAASDVVTAVYDYKKHAGVFPESLMQVATAANMKDLSRKRIKYGARAHYVRTDDGFHLSYDTYAFNGQVWDLEKKAFVDIVD